MEIENQSRLFSRGFQETSYIEPTHFSIGPPHPSIFPILFSKQN